MARSHLPLRRVELVPNVARSVSISSGCATRAWKSENGSCALHAVRIHIPCPSITRSGDFTETYEASISGASKQTITIILLAERPGRAEEDLLLQVDSLDIVRV